MSLNASVIIPITFIIGTSISKIRGKSVQTEPFTKNEMNTLWTIIHRISLNISQHYTFTVLRQRMSYWSGNVVAQNRFYMRKRTSPSWNKSKIVIARLATCYRLQWFNRKQIGSQFPYLLKQSFSRVFWLVFVWETSIIINIKL